MENFKTGITNKFAYFHTVIKNMVRSAPRLVGDAGALTNRKKYRVMRSVLSEPCNNISDRNTKDGIKQSKINDHEIPVDEILYNNFSDDFDMDKQVSEQSLLGWIELIENENLHKAVKSLSIEDQIFISYIVKEQRTQRELENIYHINHSSICRKFNKIINHIRKNLF